MKGRKDDVCKGADCFRPSKDGEDYEQDMIVVNMVPEALQANNKDEDLKKEMLMMIIKRVITLDSIRKTNYETKIFVKQLLYHLRQM